MCWYFRTLVLPFYLVKSNRPTVFALYRGPQVYLFPLVDLFFSPWAVNLVNQLCEPGTREIPEIFTKQIPPPQRGLYVPGCSAPHLLQHFPEKNIRINSKILLSPDETQTTRPTLTFNGDDFDRYNIWRRSMTHVEHVLYNPWIAQMPLTPPQFKVSTKSAEFPESRAVCSPGRLKSLHATEDNLWGPRCPRPAGKPLLLKCEG